MKSNTTSTTGPLSRALITPLLAILTAALLVAPAAVRAQTFYVSSGDHTIDTVSSTGVVSLFATLPNGSNPYGLAFDSSGNLYVADIGTNQISKITPGGAVSFFASVATPTGLAFDTSGILYAASAGAGQIDKITSGGVVSLFATVSSNVHGLAFDGSGNLYAANPSFNDIRKITPGGSVSTFATLPGGTQPVGLALDGSGNLYVGDQGTNQISKITSGGVVSLFATLPGGSNPNGLAFDGSGNLYAADNNTSQISEISPDGLTVSTFATGVSLPRFIAVFPVVPEPSSWTMLAAGAGSLLAFRRGTRRS